MIPESYELRILHNQSCYGQSVPCTLLNLNFSYAVQYLKYFISIQGVTVLSACLNLVF